MTSQTVKPSSSADNRIRSGHVEAAYRYTHHMGSGERVPAMAWATWRAGRVELCGDDYPTLDAAQLEAKAVAILRSRRRV
jgi:hypothetical protein